MTWAPHRFAGLLTLTIVAGCTSGDTPLDDHRDSAAAPGGSVAAHDSAGVDAANATDSHDAHDAGTGVGEPLLAIMQRLGSSMTTLTHALMTEDHAAVQRSAGAIAAHAPIAPAELERVRSTLGADMAEFERLDAAVHGSADRLHQAAAGANPAAVVAALADVQRGCVECHSKFRSRLRTSR